ncbi:TRAF family member-associated NF-kappa-B activator isoform X2 [Sceloporus undulatus]|uniref:TRAF family member-associated NF-kappa-B activator isoform X2 n=1 Tax=Sceloporus undulatus TaxID=8520 RepID=UPI001C4C21A1|nr:TRAF family member-associated NF-kappa-B activator isoform X2 [Sceloporus undulatus]
MDKNIADQLNKAYEAFRQACMDRDSAVKELKQKEQLASESVKLKQTEEENNLKEKKIESIITIKEDEIRHLKKQLKGMNEAQNYIQARNEKPASSRQELSPGPFGAAVYERDELEAVFWSMKEEFYRIRTLARAQTDQLSKFNLRREPVTEIPFSKPIQCTDEQADEVCSPWVKRGINREVPHFTAITARETGQDEEENSVESLSKLNVKFPPTDSDTTFLESTTESPPIPYSPGTEALLQDQQFNSDLEDQDVSYSEVKCNLFEEHGTHPVTSAVHNPAATSVAKASGQTNTHVQTPLDKTLGFKAPFLYNYGTTVFPKQDDSEIHFPALEGNEVTAGSPQQPLWKPYHGEDSDLLTFASANPELDQPEICEFCQKVFPPSLTSREDFLRHLNSHFN